MLDLRTLYLTTAGISLSLGVLQLAVGRFRRDEPWLTWWGASSLLIGLGLWATASAGQVPTIVAVPLGNLLTVVGYFYLVITIRVLAHKSPRKMAWLEAIAVGAAISLVLGEGQQQYALRIAVGSLVFAACDLAIVRDGVLLVRREDLVSAKGLAALFGLTALVFLARAGLALSGSLGQSLSATGLHPAIAVIAAAVVTLRAIMVLLVAAERSHRSWEQVALHDTLTGVLNRAGLTTMVERRGLGQGASPDRPMSVLLIDVDKFKTVNDTEGHEAGDAILRLLTAVALGQLRASDMIARQGGDEFVVLLPGTSAEAALATAERIRTRFAEAAGRLHAETRPTLSIGLAQAPPEGLHLEALLAQADQALYASKRSGRNRVRRYDIAA